MLESACGSKELRRPLSRFPLRGKAGAGGFPPTPAARCAPAKSAGTHRAPAPPTRGLPPPCGSPASAARGAWQFLRDNRGVSNSHAPVEIRLALKIVYTKYLTLPERRTHNVTRWRDADMVQRWVASAWVLTEKHFRRIDGHADLWALAAILGREMKLTDQPSKEKLA